MAALNAYFAMVYFLKTNLESGGSSARSSKSEDTVTALELREC
jgi:hypothetical protein